MKFYLQPSRSQLKVFSNVCSDLVAGWIIAIFVTRDPWLLTADIILAIVALYLAIKAEELLDYES